MVLAATAGVADPFPGSRHRRARCGGQPGGWTVPTVVYATGADFTDGIPGPSLLETLEIALGQARTLASALRT